MQDDSVCSKERRCTLQRRQLRETACWTTVKLSQWRKKQNGTTVCRV